MQGKCSFHLSDENSYLNFKTFDIVNTPECGDLAKELREYLLNRPLNEIDIDFVRSRKCSHKKGFCVRPIAAVIEEHLKFFV
jgi:hypothetical protein